MAVIASAAAYNLVRLAKLMTEAGLMATVAGFAKPLPTTWPIIEMDISARKRG